MDPNLYLASYSESGSRPDHLDDPAFRESLCREMHPTPGLELLPLVRELFHRESQYCADESNDGEFYANLYWVILSVIASLSESCTARQFGNLRRYGSLLAVVSFRLTGSD